MSKRRSSLRNNDREQQDCDLYLMVCDSLSFSIYIAVGYNTIIQIKHNKSLIELTPFTTYIYQWQTHNLTRNLIANTCTHARADRGKKYYCKYGQCQRNVSYLFNWKITPTREKSSRVHKKYFVIHQLFYS
jgi:hypothetical protein